MRCRQGVSHQPIHGPGPRHTCPRPRALAFLDREMDASGHRSMPALFSDASAMFNVLRPCASPQVQARQSLSSLLFCSSDSRLQLLWRASGSSSLQQWQTLFAEHAGTLRRTVLTVSACIYRRHICVVKTMPWPLLQLADPRVGDNDKRRIAAEFDRLNQCCAPAGVTRQLKEAGVTGSMLMNCPTWQLFLRMFGVLVRQSICDVEILHGRSRARSHQAGQTVFHNFVAEHVTTKRRLCMADFVRKKRSCPRQPRKQSRASRG